MLGKKLKVTKVSDAVYCLMVITHLMKNPLNTSNAIELDRGTKVYSNNVGLSILVE
jgi:hypothetical protein